jgi:hypothetical protein
LAAGILPSPTALVILEYIYQNTTPTGLLSSVLWTTYVMSTDRKVCRRVRQRVFVVDDATAGRHPLGVSGVDHTGIAGAIEVLKRAVQHKRDGFDPAMRMP